MKLPSIKANNRQREIMCPVAPSCNFKGLQWKTPSCFELRQANKKTRSPLSFSFANNKSFVNLFLKKYFRALFSSKIQTKQMRRHREMDDWCTGVGGTRMRIIAQRCEFQRVTLGRRAHWLAALLQRIAHIPFL